MTSYYVKLVDRWEKCSPFIDMNCIVCEDKNIICTVAEYTDIAEIMSMELIIEKDITISNKELAGGLLWEITYLGIPDIS